LFFARDINEVVKTCGEAFGKGLGDISTIEKKNSSKKIVSDGRIM